MRIVNTFETHSIFPNPPRSNRRKGQKTKKPILFENRLEFDHAIFQYLNPPPCQLQIVDCELRIEDMELIYLNNIT